MFYTGKIMLVTYQTWGISLVFMKPSIILILTLKQELSSLSPWLVALKVKEFGENSTKMNYLIANFGSLPPWQMLGMFITQINAPMEQSHARSIYICMVVALLLRTGWVLSGSRPLTLSN